MSAVVSLGVRLALGTPRQRGRSIATGLAAAASAVLVLTVLAISNASQQVGTASFSADELSRLGTLIVIVVALPVMALAATVGRLSAAIRDRRLGNLRMLGLSPIQTRIVAAIEASLAAIVGVMVGAAVFVAIKPAVGRASLAGINWETAALQPGWLGWGLALLGIPLVTAAVAALPHRFDARTSLGQTHQAPPRSPSLLRLVPLMAGIAVTGAAWWSLSDHIITGTDVALLFSGVALLGVGIILVVPVFVRLLASIILPLGTGPTALITARRLQSQPAGVTRVIAVLMIGLFLITGARAVLTAFELTPQYQQVERAMTDRQVNELWSNGTDAEQLTAAAKEVDGIREVITVPALMGNPGAKLRKNRVGEVSAIVATCDQLRLIEPTLSGCSDDAISVVDSYFFVGQNSPKQFTFTPDTDSDPILDAPTITIKTPDQLISVADVDDMPFAPLYFSMVIPPDYPGVAELVDGTARSIIVIAEPGRDLNDRLMAAGLPWGIGLDYDFYEFTASVRTIVWAIAALILGLGLLTFAIAAIDRALTRRRELARLQMVGTSPGVLRRVQWLEAALPTTMGALLAVGAGFFAGASYLQLENSSRLDFPWSFALTMGVAALIGSLAIATLTVIATNVKLTPDVVRSE